jgi:hypothetical protein
MDGTDAGRRHASRAGRVWSGVVADAIGETLRDADRAGQLSWQGQIRHVQGIHDHRPGRAWECCVGDQPVYRYQNGAYGGTATG